MSGSHYHGQTASKSRTRVKPIVRKLTRSEKNSIDLDRSALDMDSMVVQDFGFGPRSSSHDVQSTAGRRGYHARSTSGTSQFSTATNGSHRTGSFVHPFAQTPRPYTPPLAASYTNSLRESEHSNSAAQTEDEDQIRHTFRSASNLSTRTPSLTSAVSPTTTVQPSLRIQTKQQPGSRLALGPSNNSLSTLSYLSPRSPDIPSATDTMTPISAVRTSIDKGFRIRSHSSHAHQTSGTETIEEARRKFREREEAKDEKAAQEEIRQREKQEQKLARKIERGHRRSSASEGTRNHRSKSDLTMHSHNEKGDSFVSRDYRSASVQDPPLREDEIPQRSRSHTATSSAKKKTHSAWTKFMMWLRTRFIRMGKKEGRS
ncbi:hypothetical protein B0O99DRAFT_684903 [Bisporella sp. PMI_857]|nr:hypothetical protein B0O99DRAFT_684903 [Bisporella sp. PMI_857]